MAKIKNMLLHVQMTEDSQPIQVQTAQADYIMFDITRAKQKWPSYDEAPFLWSAFLAWHAARRLGLLPNSLLWEEFSASVYEVQADADGPVDVDPTQ